MELLNRTIADIYEKTDLDKRHKRKGNHNKILIEKILKENIEKETIKILSMTFGDVLKEIRKENNLEEFLNKIRTKVINNGKKKESESEQSIEENINEDYIILVLKDI